MSRTHWHWIAGAVVPLTLVIVLAIQSDGKPFPATTPLAAGSPVATATTAVLPVVDDSAGQVGNALLRSGGGAAPMVDDIDEEVTGLMVESDRRLESDHNRVTAPTPAPATAPRAEMPERSPVQLGVREEPIAAIDKLVRGAIGDGLFPGAVVAVARDGALVKHQAYGHAALYASRDRRLENPVAAASDTMFDIASLTKVFTTVAVMKLVEAGALDLNAPVGGYLPEFAANGKASVTVKHLLTHTGGLPEGVSGLSAGAGRAEVLQRAFAASLRFSPGTGRLYSDIDFIVLGELVHRVSGTALDRFVAEHITDPLGMVDTMYAPPPALWSRIAATEQFPPPRGLLHGLVHDTTAWRMGGVAGHAGLFSTAADLVVFGQMMLNGGEYAGRRILAPETVAAMIRPQAQASGNGLGWELNEKWYMGALSSSRSFGHTGYTGTSLVVSPERKAVVVLLTNRVHPVAKTSVNVTRKGLSDLVASALGRAVSVVESTHIDT